MTVMRIEERDYEEKMGNRKDEDGGEDVLTLNYLEGMERREGERPNGLNESLHIDIPSSLLSSILCTRTSQVTCISVDKDGNRER